MIWIWEVASPGQLMKKLCKIIHIQYQTLKTSVGHTWHPMVPSESMRLWSHETILGPRRALGYHRRSCMVNSSFHYLRLYFFKCSPKKVFQLKLDYWYFDTRYINFIKLYIECLSTPTIITKSSYLNMLPFFYSPSFNIIPWQIKEIKISWIRQKCNRQNRQL